MSVRVQLPPVLRNVMGGERWLAADGGTVQEALRDLSARHPQLALHLFDEQGAVRHNIVCLCDGALVRAGEMASRSVQPGDELVLTTALAGG
jgi:molybdopterin converting factor small subunit